MGCHALGPARHAACSGRDTATQPFRRDRAVREGIASLFDKGVDPMVVIRWKDIFERLEEAIDAAEHVADTLETIVIKNS